MVLMRGLDQEGFRFYSNRESRKGDELAANPWAAIAFYWEPPGLQLRAEGPVRPLDDEASDAYFESRPRESQLGAWASQQSRELESREVLLDAYAQEQRRWGESAVARPPHWGGSCWCPSDRVLGAREHGCTGAAFAETARLDAAQLALTSETGRCRKTLMRAHVRAKTAGTMERQRWEEWVRPN
jgi:hypothetical protein